MNPDSIPFLAGHVEREVQLRNHRLRRRSLLIGIALCVVLAVTPGATAKKRTASRANQSSLAYAIYYANGPFATLLPNGQTIYQAWVETKCGRYANVPAIRVYLCLQTNQGGPWSGCGGTYHPEVVLNATGTSETTWIDYYDGTFSCIHNASYRTKAWIYYVAEAPAADYSAPFTLC